MLSKIRIAWKDYLWADRLRRCHQIDRAGFLQSAIVFSPHPDDDVLGCGGVIAKKRAIGAHVIVVMMTDGASSHSKYIARQELVSMRSREVLKAAEVLGVDSQSVVFLGYEDRKLNEVEVEAIHEVASLLQMERPEEVYIPYYLEYPPDHAATNRIVKRALRTCSFVPIVYEYPIWFWQHWPWVHVPQSLGRRKLRYLLRSFSHRFGLRIIDFSEVIFIGDVLQVKREALAQHRSQMTRTPGQDQWPTLADVSNGEWLALFFREHEIFHRC